jgi:glycosyltransferase involved in cell wall biosynthesis
MTTAQRVLFIQTQGENAGAQEISRLVGEGLSRRGYEVEHLFFYKKSSSFNAPPWTTYCIEKRPTTPIDAIRFVWGLARAIRRSRPDAIMTFQHYGNTVGGVIASLVSPAALVANQVSPRITYNGLVRATDWLLGYLGMYDCITVNSAAMEKEYRQYPRRYSDKVRYIPHGFDRKTTSLSKSEARAFWGLPQNVPLLGSVARLHGIKRLDAAIRLLTVQPTWHLGLAGQGPDEKKLKDLARELGVSDRTHFVGDMPPDRIGDFLASLDVFVFPTSAETFGLAAVEAASAGVPVVATDLPVLREVLCSGGKPAATFVDSADQRALAAAVSRALYDDDLRGDLIEAGKGLRSRYSVDRMVEEYVTILNDLRSSDVRQEVLER